MTRSPTPLRLGLTGGIGSGKSTVAAMFVAHGATLVDTDAIARAATSARGAAITRLIAEFGPGILDAEGALDRTRMRALVFSDASAKLRLEAVLHPLIGAEAARQADHARSHIVLFDVPLLAESAHWRARCDRILVVDCSAETQLRRVMERSGWDRAQVQRVIDQQSSRSRRRAIADAVIHNDDLPLDALSREVDVLWAHWHGPGTAL